MSPSVTGSADGDELPKKLVADVFVGDVMDLLGRGFTTAFADAAGAFDH
jgi:hypothetical protein